jgi:hypothetical protein
MKKSNLKNIIIALLLSLVLIGTTIFVCVIVLKGDNADTPPTNGEGTYEPIGTYDPEGWTDPE